MNKPTSMNLKHYQTQSLKQTQRLMMSPQMQQAIHLLQLPVMELQQVIQQEIEQNPVLEYMEVEGLPKDQEELGSSEQVKEDEELILGEEKFEILKRLDDEFQESFYDAEKTHSHRTQEDLKKDLFRETSIVAEQTLPDFLMQQVNETFTQVSDRKLAQWIIGNLDERGFLESPLEELEILYDQKEGEFLRVLQMMQSFEPSGVCVQNLKESLLVQLKSKRKEKKLAYKIVEHCYEDLLRNRLPNIQKKLKEPLEKIQEEIHKEIAILSFRPGYQFLERQTRYAVPDISIYKEGNKLRIEGHEESFPSLKLNQHYLKLLKDPEAPKATKEYVHQKITSGQWLMKNLDQRLSTLTRIANALIEYQEDFLLNVGGQLRPLTMKILAEKLGVHESTIARAVSNKYISIPRGVVPLRSFFTNALATEKGGEISANSVREELENLIQGEDKKSPFSDEVLSRKLQAKGICCARRTVAKYRRELNIGKASQRRIYKKHTEGS